MQSKGSTQFLSTGALSSVQAELSFRHLPLCRIELAFVPRLSRVLYFSFIRSDYLYASRSLLELFFDVVVFAYTQYSCACSTFDSIRIVSRHRQQ